MNNLAQFWTGVKQEMAALLATSADGSVTMRTVSPVYHQDAILIFTSPDSLKYRQMKENPKACIAVGGCFAQVEAVFLGPTMGEENEPLRQAYTAKFADAFEESAVFGGRTAEFILLKPTQVTGWAMENGMPTGPFAYDLP